MTKGSVVPLILLTHPCNTAADRLACVPFCQCLAIDISVHHAPYQSRLTIDVVVEVQRMPLGVTPTGEVAFRVLELV